MMGTGMDQRRAEMARNFGTGPVRRIEEASVRMGVMEKSEKELKDDSFVVYTLQTRMNGVPYTFAFVVNRFRGIDEFLQVANQDKVKSKPSKYGADLFHSCFKNW